MAKTKETRTFDITKLSTRDATEEQPSKITGYAAVFNSKTTIGGWFDEVIEPGAFARSLSENSDIRALFNHNWDNVLGRTKSGTLILEEDEKGLKFEIELPNTSVGRDLAESMSRGDINQCSFGFWITEENWDYSVEPALRTIKEVELYEISVVSIPAYEDTEVSLVRSKEIGKEIEQRMKMIKQINQILGEK
ncbi:prohead protease [Bacillus thuringiensis serovar tolworthi]|uniref:Prohead protease n=1 Tax=Bacillus thuringiensis subsp. tolworthi TaxID=1442 RepID=A0A9W3ZRH6_BACTO|nr:MULTISPECIES: HK97 family phage prohead protease [Bacillus cereus group]MEB8714962.1 HK97 family phage prohead protease [Bacillus cereus]MRB05599.1 HK97 family phage prohead protease [Bacillus thuringiensis]MEB9431083.1 HK97 family phage prohead protease [Bacillus cereus]MEB9482572.1 HK97 family phage prohead protease [Bacillus cereus]MEB9590290.1 HK97 family phage prohead protease [Bacillus cereus]